MKKTEYQNPQNSAFYQERIPNYQCNPIMNPGFSIIDLNGYEKILCRLKEEIHNILQKSQQAVLVIDCYDGISSPFLEKEFIYPLYPNLSICSDSCRLPEAEFYRKYKDFICPEDSTYGVYCPLHIEDYFDNERIQQCRQKIQQEKGLIIVYGVAASYLFTGDILIYGNITKTELQYRLMKGAGNWGADNANSPYSEKEKRGNFLDWKALDIHKRCALKQADFIIDFNHPEHPVMITGKDFLCALQAISRRPFQLVPLFMPAVWGGKWIQKIVGVGKDQPNMGWAINGYLDVQSMKLQCQNSIFEFPGNDLVQLLPRDVLGDKIFYFWGYKCPIHTNILDTWGGENLSLQVHPTTAYALETFNSPRGHHESYYILDTQGNKSVYLGLKKGAKKDDLVKALKEAQITGYFVEKLYVNQIPVKKHDHLSIPGGTLHCSGEGNVVLEIDEFWFATLKLWDWGRMDLDGTPRPIHINHGQHCIQENFQTDWVRNNLIGQQPQIEQGDGFIVEDSSTMPYEPMEVLRYWFHKRISLPDTDVIRILVLVEGESAVIESADGAFPDFPIHYAEATFIPAACGPIHVRPEENNKSEQGLGILCIRYPM